MITSTQQKYWGVWSVWCGCGWVCGCGVGCGMCGCVVVCGVGVVCGWWVWVCGWLWCGMGVVCLLFVVCYSLWLRVAACESVSVLFYTGYWRSLLQNSRCEALQMIFSFLLASLHCNHVTANACFFVEINPSNAERIFSPNSQSLSSHLGVQIVSL
jgi:hypothetical protein